MLTCGVLVGGGDTSADVVAAAIVGKGVGSDGATEVSEDGDKNSPATEADRDDGGQDGVEGCECVHDGFSFRERETGTGVFWIQTLMGVNMKMEKIFQIFVDFLVDLADRGDKVAFGGPDPT